MALVNLSRNTDYRIEATQGSTSLVGKKIRLLLTAERITLKTNGNGFLEGLRAYLLSGKQAGSTIDLPPCKLKYSERKSCRCVAYKFPHAMGFGACKAEKFEQEAPTGLSMEHMFTTRRS
jgi:hypothetical protein